MYTAAKTSNNKGGGTAKGGGSPSTAAGHFVSFGCTEEKLVVENVGRRARGVASEGPFSVLPHHRRWLGAPSPLAAGVLPRCDRRQETSCAC